MIRKLVDLISKKVFIPKSELQEVETQTSLLEKKAMHQKPVASFIGAPAPVETPKDSWFADVNVESIKTEKQLTHEQMLEEAARREEENRKEEKEPENIHQKMYEMATKNWTTVAETQGGSENFQEGLGGWNSGVGFQSGTGYNQFRG